MRRYDIHYEDERCDRDRPLPLIPPPGAVWAVSNTDDKEILAVIGDRWLDVRIARKELGWTIEALAERCSVSPETVSRWEEGTLPGADERRRLQQVFDTPIEKR